MSTPGDSDLEAQQRLAPHPRTSTPREREAVPREEHLRQQDTPAASRRAHVAASLVFIAGAVAGLVRGLGGQRSAAELTVYGAAIVVSGTAAVLSYRGRTRISFAVLAAGLILVGLAALMPG